MSRNYFEACRNCTDKRHPGCHSTCEDYIKAKEKQHEDYVIEHNQRLGPKLASEFKDMQVNKRLKRKRRS